MIETMMTSGNKIRKNLLNILHALQSLLLSINPRNTPINEKRKNATVKIDRFTRMIIFNLISPEEAIIEIFPSKNVKIVITTEDIVNCNI